MKTLTHKLSGHTYQAIEAVNGGVLFLVKETGEQKEMSNNQIKFMFK